MLFDIHPSFTRQRATFNVIIAPEDTLLPALAYALQKTKKPVQYLCGDVTEIFARLIAYHNKTRLQRVESFWALIHTIEETEHTSIFIEHDRKLCEQSEDSIGQFVQACREKAYYRNATVILFSTRIDGILQRISENANRAVFVDQLVVPKGSKKMYLRGTLLGEQRTLEGIYK